MSIDRITQLRISGLRVIREATLDLKGLTVLVGDNGTGKSSIVEALEMLRQASLPGVSFCNDIIAKGHGGLRGLLARGADELRLGVTVEGGGPRIDYDLSIGQVGGAAAVMRETASVRPSLESAASALVLDRKGRLTRAFAAPDYDMELNENPTAIQTFEDHELAIGGRDMFPAPTLFRLIGALSHTEVHVPFEVRPLWQQREMDLRAGPRWPSEIERTESLSRYAFNLPNAYQELRNTGGEVWKRVLGRARLGLGPDVRDFRLTPSGRGNIELEVLFGSAPDKPLPAEYLSEGQLAYLAFLALVELHPRRSVLAFDEPEIHLHPALLARVLYLFEELAQTCPVLLSTHSDRLLDALADPAGSVVLCELADDRTLTLRRPNAERLAAWLETYRGLGSLRAEGYEAHVFDDAPAEPTGELG